jgi:hypothetical protein
MSTTQYVVSAKSVTGWTDDRGNPVEPPAYVRAFAISEEMEDVTSVLADWETEECIAL